MKLAGQLLETAAGVGYFRYRKEARERKRSINGQGFYAEMKPVYTLTKAEVALLKAEAKRRKEEATKPCPTCGSWPMRPSCPVKCDDV